MKIYLVGGAVRDTLLNKPVHERDWVVVSGTIEDMINQGFKPVGKAFPVFLHPQTKEEYALARTEQKVSKGYKGFTFYTSPDVTLEQDLARRNLTINAIAQDNNGNLTTTNISVKTNLKTWLQKNKMLNDGIDIIDATIINIGFSFEAVTDPTLNSLSVLSNVNSRLQDTFSEKMSIGEPLYINQIYNTINKTRGVVDTVKVNLEIKQGPGYASVPIDIMDIMSKDGSYIKTPKNCILEIKNFTTDIKGASV